MQNDPVLLNACGKLVVAISSRALFDLDESHRVYEEQGVEAYSQYQIDNESVPLNPGCAFNIAQKLLNLNSLTNSEVVEVILLSRNSADTGLRIFNSIQHYQLPIARAVFCSGKSPYPYVAAFKSHLFLSTHAEDVRSALGEGLAAASIMPSPANNQASTEEIRIAFDGDSVIFSDEAEQIYQNHGLDAFSASESNNADKPLMGGPFKQFLNALHQLQKSGAPIRTALVTARAAPAHERVIKTLRAWDIRIDEALFLGGLAKGEFLKAFNADLFFDDQLANCTSAGEHVTTGHVPSGVMNRN